MPRGKQDKKEEKRGRGKGGGKWESGGSGGLSREQREAVDAMVTSNKKHEKRKEERRVRRMVREEMERPSSDSDSDSSYHRHKKKGRRNGKPSSSDSDSSSEEERKRRQKEKRDKQRQKTKTKREGKIAESRLALQQVAELKKIIEEKEAAEKKAKAAAEAEAKPPPEPKYTIEEVKAIIGLSRTRAKEKTPEVPAAAPKLNPPKPRTLFEAITCSCEVVVSPEPKSNASVDSIATSITTLLKDKLELAEATQSLSLGMGSTNACRAECNKIAAKVAKHYTSLEDVENLKAVLVNSNIDSQCKQCNTIISKLLEGIATRGIEITSAELHI